MLMIKDHNALEAMAKGKVVLLVAEKKTFGTLCNGKK
jgi:hypothetical protein